MSKMYDSAEGTIPQLPDGGAGCDILIPTDGKWFANGQAMRAQHPNATVHTISETGQTPAEWIDCEPGCVWPPSSAISLYRAWRGHGCRGFYSNLSTQHLLKELLAQADNADLHPEWFDADWDNIDRVDPGNLATQYESLPGYDISETSPTFENQPTPPPPAAQPVHFPGENMTLLAQPCSTGPDGTGWTDFQLNGATPGVTDLEAAAGTQDGSTTPGVEYDKAVTRRINGAAPGAQRVSITGGIPNTGYTVFLLVSP